MLVNSTGGALRGPILDLDLSALRKLLDVNVVACAAAAQALAHGMTLEWAGSGVTVNAIAPVQTPTDLSRPSWNNPVRRAQVISRIPICRWATTDDLVGPFLHLASDASAMMTGQTLSVDGGRSLL